MSAFFIIIKFWTAQNPSFTQRSGVSEDKKKYEALNGVYVVQDASLLRPVAVIVENHPDSRPQSGLSQADVVYEVLAEGGITRFLALYQLNNADAIGPVRSAREYFAQIADEWGALFAHVGGSNEVISQLKKGKYKNLDDANEYYNFEFFPRRKNRPEPHHIFTSSSKLKSLMAYHQFSEIADYQPWQFKNNSPVATSTAKNISIDFSRPGYEVGWNYNASQNAYKRSQYFEPHLDELTNQQITAKTVIAQIVNVIPVQGDPLLSVDIDLNGNGKALVFMDGGVVAGMWRKEGSRTRFYDSLNAEIKFNRGPIWLELVPKEKENKIAWQ